MTIAMCVGSSCHLKGSYEVIGLMKDALSRHGLTAQVNLCAAFCLGRCSTTGVTVKVDDTIVSGVNPDNFESVFNQYVLGGMSE